MSYRKFSTIKVGIFVTIAVAIVLSVIFWAKGSFLKKNQIDLKAYFKDVSGLNVGDPVTVSGVKKGNVVEFDLVGDSVLVDFRIDKDVKIKKDYKIQVAMVELMSGKQLYIFPGKEGEEIDYSKPMIGEPSSDMTSLMKGLSVMTNDVKELINKVGKTTDNLTEVLKNVNDIVGDNNMKSDLKVTLSNIRVTTSSLNYLVTENRSTLKELTSKLGKTVDNVNGMLDENSPEIKNTFKDIQSLTVKVDSLVSGINNIVGDIKDQKSTMGKFMYDDKFYDNLNKTLKEIEKLTKKIRQDGIKINLF